MDVGKWGLKYIADGNGNEFHLLEQQIAIPSKDPHPMKSNSISEYLS